MTERRRKLVKEIKDDANSPVEKKSFELFPTNSQMLNLSCTGSIDAGFPLGAIVNIIGGSSSGKSYIALSTLAEATLIPKLYKYHLLYHDIENGCKFSIEKLYGKKVAKRIILTHNTDTLESWLDDLYSYLNEGKSVIAVCDSWDALTTEVEIDKFEDDMKNRAKGKDSNGSYGMNKAKGSHQVFRLILDKLESTNSLLIIISQTKDKIGSIFAGKSRVCANSLDFNSSLLIWTAVKEKIKKTIKGKSYQVGVNTLVKITKNRINGRLRDCIMSIKYDLGVDNLLDCIQYMVEVKAITGTVTKQNISCKEFDFEGTKSEFINHIEENDLENKFYHFVQTTWNEIEALLIEDTEKRKNKFKHE